MSWKDVGNWLKDNGAASLGLVGSLVTGNVPGALAAGTALVASATGTTDPAKALMKLQSDPQTVARLEELAYQNEADIRQHLEDMTRLELEDEQHAHQTTQATVQAGDKADDAFVRWTRPGQSWVSLAGALAYVFTQNTVDVMVLSALLALPFAYAGLRQIGKGVDSVAGVKKLGKLIK